MKTIINCKLASLKEELSKQNWSSVIEDIDAILFYSILIDHLTQLVDE